MPSEYDYHTKKGCEAHPDRHNIDCLGCRSMPTFYIKGGKVVKVVVSTDVRPDRSTIIHAKKCLDALGGLHRPVD